jgi:hypothetical protein
MKGIIFSFFVGALLALILQPFIFPVGFLSTLQQGFNTLFGR